MKPVVVGKGMDSGACLSWNPAGHGVHHLRQFT